MTKGQGKKTAAVRSDQTQCPECKAWGCPRKGSRSSPAGVVQYRCCRKCGHTFKTLRRWLDSRGGSLSAREEVN